MPAVSALYSFYSVVIVTDGRKSFPTLPVAIGICIVVVIVAAVMFPGGIYMWYHKKKTERDGNACDH